MPVTAFSDIDSDLTKRLGQIVINWGVIEAWLGHLLGTLIDADPGGANVLTNEMGAAGVIRAIKNCIALSEPKMPDLKLVRALIEEADDLRQERNVFVHGIWEPGPEPKTALVQTTGWQRSEIVRELLVTPTELDQLLADFDDWIRDFVTLGIQFGFPRRKGETKSIFAD